MFAPVGQHRVLQLVQFFFLIFKTARDIYMTLDTEFERDRSIGLASTIGDGQTDRETDTHTQFF